VLRQRKKYYVLVVGIAAAVAAAVGISSSSATSALPQAVTPIQHVVVIFDENVSFDHYFATYPTALNPPGEPAFHALAGTPSVNGLDGALLTANPNLDLPARLGPSQALTCDQNHGYSAEEAAFDGGLMDKFVQDTTGSGCTESNEPDNGSYGPNGIVMDYYDGNTVTAMWNLAQHFSLNDNSYSTTFGPSSPGALNLIAGQTNGAVIHGATTSTAVANGTLFGDAEPYYDQCSNSTLALNSDGSPGGTTVSLSGRNIGDLMNAAGLTWGWFQGGFAPSSIVAGRAICATAHTNIGGASVADYSEHHEPFQYYATTANPDHVAPSSVSEVGYSDPAGTAITSAVNHQYDISWFAKAITAGDLPQVSFLKAPEYEDGHAGYSDPLDEQRWLATEVNAIEQSSAWPSTAIIIAYDDSDGWYDHQMGPIITPSEDTADDLDGPGKCGSATVTPSPNDRCGVGPRQPLLVISPWAKENFVDNTFTDQSSILRFIEDNWSLGRIGNSADAQAGTLDNMFDFDDGGHAPAVILSPQTGEVTNTVSTGGSPASASTGATGPSGTSGQLGYCPVAIKADHRLVVSCTIDGQARRASVVRARLYHGSRLLGNESGAVHAGRAGITFALGKDRSSSYTVRVTIDVAGAVSALTERVSVR
jgi:phospholipase C